jgi:transglutaminase-like putative cysteine protease
VSAAPDTARGNCFTTAAGFLRSGMPQAMCAAARIPYRKDERGPFRVVHGTPIATGGPLEGERYWHAWIEVDVPGAAGVVLDYSNGKQAHIPRLLFYLVGQLAEEHVWRFTLAEAEREYRRWRHCGPWVPGWENIADGDA